MTQFNPRQQAEALALLEQMLWGDMDHAIYGLEICLRRALEATFEDYLRWENDIGPAYEEDGYEECTLPRELIEEMSPEDKLAYLARLIRDLAIDYGVGYELGAARPGVLVAEADKSSIAALLRGLNDILWMPTTGDTVE